MISLIGRLHGTPPEDAAFERRTSSAPPNLGFVSDQKGCSRDFPMMTLGFSDREIVSGDFVILRLR